MSEQPSNESVTDPKNAAEADDNQVNVEEMKQQAEAMQESVNQETELQELQDKLAAADQLANEHREAALRAKAESDNIRRRAERDVEQAHKFALEKFVESLLPVLDSLEQGLQQPTTNDESSALKQGMELTLKMFEDALSKKNVVTLNPIGQPFNPAEHEAMSMQENPEFEPNAVIAVFQKGYSLNGRIVRPARVVVNKGKPANIDEKV